jgi:hypothetical protein
VRTGMCACVRARVRSHARVACALRAEAHILCGFAVVGSVPLKGDWFHPLPGDANTTKDRWRARAEWCTAYTIGGIGAIGQSGVQVVVRVPLLRL